MWRRERWHLAACVAAALLLTARLADRSSRPDPWGQEQHRVAQRLEQTLGAATPSEVRAQLATHPGLAARLTLFGAGISGAMVAGWLLLGQALVRRWRRRPVVAGPWWGPPEVPWGVWGVVKLFAWLICGMAAVALGQLLALRLAPGAAMDRHLGSMIGTALMDGLAIGLVWLVVLRPARRSRAAVGVRWQALGRQGRLAAWGYLVWLPLLGVTVVAVTAVCQWWGLEPAPQQVVAMLVEETRPGLLAALLGLAAVLGPIAEELVFRGVAYAGFRRRFGARGALIASAALFAVVHGEWIALAPIFVLGLLFGWLYERTGSLIPSMAIHIAHNSVMLAGALTMRDLARVVGGAS